LSRIRDRADSFVRYLTLYRNCCRRIENELSAGRLKITDVELVYSSSFLSVSAQWEAFVEDVIFEAVLGERSQKGGNRRYVMFQSRQRMQDVLLYPGKDYISLPTLSKAEELASLFIQDGRPITAVSEQNRTYLKQASWIRNAIAHRSSHSLRTFRAKVPGVETLPRSKRSPGAFLRHEFRVSPKQRRYEVYFAAFRSASVEIADAW
jgi:hypothetical protein